jgi:hypothetical protein
VTKPGWRSNCINVANPVVLPTAIKTTMPSWHQLKIVVEQRKNPDGRNAKTALRPLLFI